MIPYTLLNQSQNTKLFKNYLTLMIKVEITRYDFVRYHDFVTYHDGINYYSNIFSIFHHTRKFSYYYK